ncbi:MAG TPA: plastocyanin/azurin family copper-binding protein [Actinomycetota bacterium]|nr:plastocyanin/azurin family copper-binding protein [Actinomycetota bacterium]
MVRRSILLSLLAVLPVATACAGTGETGDGEVRTIEIAALDELAFEPSEVRVEAGETVRFVVTNEGQTPHEFVLGDERVQEAHEMVGMEHGEATVEAMAALTLDPGTTGEVTVTFEEPGEILYGCHVPGHYDGGMVGKVIVG